MNRIIFSALLLVTMLCMVPLKAWAFPTEVNSITPANGATGVALTMQVVVVFNVDMNNVTIAGTNNIVLRKYGNNPNINPTSITYDSTTRTAVASFTGLAANTSYTIRLKSGFYNNSIKTSAGTQINGGYNYDGYSFTTGGAAAVPPAVITVSPADGATGIALTTTISATFSADIDSSTLTSASFSVSNGVTPAAVNGISYNSATKTVTFTPSANLSFSTTYTVTITTAVKDTTGTSMAANKVWSFTTKPPDTTPPTVTSTSPANGATDIAQNAVITATFSEAMAQTTVEAAGSFVLNNGITGTVSYNPTTWVATFTPSTLLAKNTTYTATISTAVTDEAGNHLVQNKVWTFVTSGNYATTTAPLNNYCSVPPFVTSGANALNPNVLLIIDNSGSMNEFAYKASGKGDSSHGIIDWDDSYSSVTPYYGYFDNTKMYSYDTSNGNFYVDGTKKPQDDTSFWSGNMLNWLTMRRVDVVRKVLVGGKTIPRSANQANYLLVSNNSDRNFYKTYDSVRYEVDDKLYVCNSTCSSHTAAYNMKVYIGTKQPQDGILLQAADKLNFGIMNFNDGYKFEDNQNSVRDGGQVTVDIGSTGTNLITQVENTDPTTWTPLAETLYESLRYFQATTSAYNGGTYSGKDPITANCMKNFVLILTDGESTKDRNIPGGNWGTPTVSDSNFNAKDYMAKIAANEGTASKWAVSPNTDEGSWYLPGVALFAHTTDQRSDTIGKNNLPGMQNITIYTVLAFDDSTNAQDLLKLTSKYGGFEDSAMSSSSLPDSTAKWDSNGDGLPDTFYMANNGDVLQAKLLEAFNDILSKVSSGTSASIVNNRGESGANLFQAVFYPKKSVGDRDLYWIGELQNMWYYLDPYLGTSSIREDTNNDKQLDLKQDYKVTVDYDTTKNQTVANWFRDTSGTGIFTPVGTGSPDNIHALWKAGALLHYRDPSTRTIFTTLGSYNSGYLSNTVPLASGVTSGLTLFDTAHGASIVSLDYAKANIPSAATSANNLLNVDGLTTGNKIINYIRGVDYLNDPLYRSRTVTITYPTTAAAPLNTTIADKTWKLGDIVSSTPQAQTSKQLQAYDSSYKDNSYSLFYGSADYSIKNMVYAGANDGMLHAFRVGQVAKTQYDSAVPNRIAKINNLDNTLNLGDEEWAFIPQNALPYLKYLPDPAYNHLFYVNNTVALLDVSINKTASDPDPACTQAEYWKCAKKTTYSDAATKTLNADETSWRTVLIGGMGFGGASRDYSGYCNKDDGTTPTSSAQETRLDCVKSPIPGSGLSSFFALDVTDPKTPAFMWEFSDAVLPDADKGLGYTTSGPAIVRINTKSPASATIGDADTTKNGRWFAVFATGPSGPIDTASHQFMGRSDNELKIYVVDIHPDMSNGWVKGTNYWVLSSGIANAFASDLTDSVIDVDRWNSSSSSYYSDDAVYIGYTKPKSGTSPVEWTDGGVLRLLTNDSLDPANWSLSTMIDGIGPVTSSPTKLQDRKNGKSWVFFGTGRYFYKNNSGTDDPDSQRYLMGITDTCYNGTANTMNAGYKKINNVWTKQGCGATAPAALGLTDLQNQSTTVVSTLPSGKKGWYIALDPPGDYALGAQMVTSSYKAERVITNTTAAFNGVVFFTSFLPTDDICGYGGNTLVWAVDYLSGGTPPGSTMKGKLLVQLSGGEFVTVDLASAFKANGDDTQQTHGDRRMKASLSGHGLAGSRGGSLQNASQPVRKILHIMER